MQKRVLALLLAFTLVLMPNTLAFADYDGLEYLPTYETLADDDVTYEVIDSTVDSYVPVATIDETAVLFGEETDADLPPNSAMFGTPTLGTHDPIWETTVPLPIERSTLPAADARRGVTTGVGRVLWDEDFVYARVEVTTPEVFTGGGHGSPWMNDSVEFFLGAGNNGANQWRISAVGTLSGQSAEGRLGWTTLTETGYIVELRMPRRTVNLVNNGRITFDIGINNGTSLENTRFEVLSWFGTPDAGFGSSASFVNSLLLIGDPGLTRHRVDATVGPNGSISPAGLVRVVDGTDQTFTFTPNPNFVVDTVLVDGVEVEVTGNTFVMANVTGSARIHATFAPHPDAENINFVVWNENFATGEFTTAVIIDLGEGREAYAADLHPAMFQVLARNMRGAAVSFEGFRDIVRVYVNDEASPLGYRGPIFNSPDYHPGLDSGRFVIIEFDVGVDGGVATLDNSHSTTQVYTIIPQETLVLADGSELNKIIFNQTATVNTILDQFTPGPAVPGVAALQRAQYIHRDAAGNPVEGLPLFVYVHGMGRGGTVATDVLAPMRSPNGAVPLMQRIAENPERFASHIMVLRYSGTATPAVATVRAHINHLINQGLVDADRVYMSGFSWGGNYIHSFVNNAANRGFVAAIAPLAPVGQYPSMANVVGNENMAYWAFVNTFDAPSYETGARNFSNGAMNVMTNARVSLFRDVNIAFVWPYNQAAEPTRPADLWLPAHVGHELEAAVFFNRINEPNWNWNIKPTFQSAGLEWTGQYLDVFDWMFSQSLAGEVLPQELTVIDGQGCGVFTANSIVTITADVIEGMEFTHWEFDQEVVFVAGTTAESQTARILMPISALTATAHFEEAVTLILVDVIPTAVVTQIPGAQNHMVVTITELWCNGVEQFEVVYDYEYTMKANNSDYIIDVGSRQVFVSVRGNTQVRQIFIVE